MMECPNGCDLQYQEGGETYSRIIYHKNTSIADHWDCPACGWGCGIFLEEKLG
jgi:anaerobic selenocysteine-containing dehydrogenase